MAKRGGRRSTPRKADSDSPGQPMEITQPTPSSESGRSTPKSSGSGRSPPQQVRDPSPAVAIAEAVTSTEPLQQELQRRLQETSQRSLSPILTDGGDT